MSSIDLNSLSIEELKKIKKTQKSKLKKEFNEYKQHQEKQKLIAEINAIKISRKKINKAMNKPKVTKPIKPKEIHKIKSFDEYFKECIKNKSIPKDTPDYLKKALKRAMKEYKQGIKLEKSALKNFAKKYIIDDQPKVIPKDYLKIKDLQIKDF